MRTRRPAVSKPVLKDSLSKQSSVIIEHAPQIPNPQESVITGKPLSPSPALTNTRSGIVSMKQTYSDTGADQQPLQPKPGLASAEPHVPVPAPADSWLLGHKQRDTTSMISNDDGPEEAAAYVPSTRQPVRAHKACSASGEVCAQSDTPDGAEGIG
jgi:hypothetical protein